MSHKRSQKKKQTRIRKGLAGVRADGRDNPLVERAPRKSRWRASNSRSAFVWSVRINGREDIQSRGFMRSVRC